MPIFKLILEKNFDKLVWIARELFCEWSNLLPPKVMWNGKEMFYEKSVLGTQVDQEVYHVTEIFMILCFMGLHKFNNLY